MEIKGYNVMIDGRNFFDQNIRNDIKTYENIIKFAIGQGYDYTAVCLLDYPYLKKNYNLITIDLSKLQGLNADTKAIKQINSTGSLDRAEAACMFFILEVVKETIIDFFT